jgi:hypothetical protein
MFPPIPQAKSAGLACSPMIGGRRDLVRIVTSQVFSAPYEPTAGIVS